MAGKKKEKPNFHSLNSLIQSLLKLGCYPGIYFRGYNKKEPVWRAHVNCAGNYWEEAKTPYAALKAAVKLWDSRGRPVDGMAAIPKERVTREKSQAHLV
jgi:hypothetical protein